MHLGVCNAGVLGHLEGDDDLPAGVGGFEIADGVGDLGQSVAAADDGGDAAGLNQVRELGEVFRIHVGEDPPEFAASERRYDQGTNQAADETESPEEVIGTPAAVADVDAVGLKDAPEVGEGAVATVVENDGMRPFVGDRQSLGIANIRQADESDRPSSVATFCDNSRLSSRRLADGMSDLLT